MWHYITIFRWYNCVTSPMKRLMVLVHMFLTSLMYKIHIHVWYLCHRGTFTIITINGITSYTCTLLLTQQVNESIIHASNFQPMFLTNANQGVLMVSEIPMEIINWNSEGMTWYFAICISVICQAYRQQQCIIEITTNPLTRAAETN